MSGLLRESREVKKVKALLRAQFALKQRYDRIDFEEDVVIPEVEAMLAGRSVLGLEPGTAFELVIENVHENPAPTQTDTATRRDPPAANGHPPDEPSAPGA